MTDSPACHAFRSRSAKASRCKRSLSVAMNTPGCAGIQIGPRIGDQPGDGRFGCAGRLGDLCDEGLVRRERGLASCRSRADGRLVHARGRAAARTGHHQLQG